MAALPLGTLPSTGVAEIALINESTVVTDAQVQTAMAALQKQISRDFAPIWNIDAKLTFFAAVDKAKVPTSSWQIAMLDNSDQAGALGYHDITATGQPLGKVFAKSDLTYKTSWTVTLSHECLEMLGDPNINLGVFCQSSNTAGMIVAYENCDAVEDDSLGYSIDGVLLSDFVTPAWFETWRTPHSAKFDFCGHCTSPLEILTGGYAGTFNVTAGGGWTQTTAQESRKDPNVRPDKGGRYERRTLPRDRWIESAPLA